MNGQEATNRFGAVIDGLSLVGVMRYHDDSMSRTWVPQVDGSLHIKGEADAQRVVWRYGPEKHEIDVSNLSTADAVSAIVAVSPPPKT